MPKSIMLQITCACPWACMSPPITPKLSQGLPSLVTKPGMIVWNGRFLRLQPVEMVRVEREQAAAVLEREAQVARHVVRAEAVEVALDQADAVEVAVDDRHVNRVGLRRVARHRVQVGPLRLDLAPDAGRRRAWRSGRDRQRAEVGVGVVLGPVFVGQLLGLDHQVKRLGRLRPHRS